MPEPPSPAPTDEGRSTGRPTRPGSPLDATGQLTDAEVRRVLDELEGLLPPAAGTDPRGWPAPPAGPADSPFSDADLIRLRTLLYERARRRKEALSLYEPLPFQAEFHASMAPERSLRASNRAGKTLSAAVEVARAVTGRDPHGKYPPSGRALLVGKDEKHCGEVMYRKLFKPGAFKIIRDLATGRWRPYRPDLDQDRRRERRDAPPLIPRRYYNPRAVAWSKKKEEIPKKIVIRPGTDREWELNFFSSLGPAPQGVDVTLIWFDEEVEHVSWYNEMAMRLIDRAEWDDDRGCWVGGKFFWSATPAAGTLKLFEIHKRALEERGNPNPAVTEHHATLFDNTYLAERAKRVAVAKLGGSEDEIKVRIYGEFALAGMRIYPQFDPTGPHGCDAFDIPEDWTRYIAIDPGWQVCAVLFAAVPPPHLEGHGGRVYLYDELYMKRCDAEVFGHELAMKLHGQVVWEAIIDSHAGRLTEMGSGRSVEDQYREALKSRHVRFGGAVEVGFTPGSDDPQARISEVRAGLHLEDGRSVRWVVFRDRVPNLIWEFEHYRTKKDMRHGVLLDQPLKLNDHLMDALGMLAAHGTPYRRPARVPKGGYAVRYLKEKAARRRARHEVDDGIRVG